MMRLDQKIIRQTVEKVRRIREKKFRRECLCDNKRDNPAWHWKTCWVCHRDYCWTAVDGADKLCCSPKCRRIYDAAQKSKNYKDYKELRGSHGASPALKAASRRRSANNLRRRVQALAETLGFRWFRIQEAGRVWNIESKLAVNIARLLEAGLLERERTNDRGAPYQYRLVDTAEHRELVGKSRVSA